MREINTSMKTYTALIKAKVGDQIKAIPVEIRASSATDARWLLQAVYGFHSVVSAPIEIKNGVKEDKPQSPQQPQTPEQAKITSLKTAKDQAADALKSERDRQKRSKALITLKTLN
jgi:hypothetical protein